jgi:hypothetical protein
MTEKEWKEMIDRINEKVSSGELQNETWDEFISYYVDYECGLSHEFAWNYRGVDYELVPIEEFGQYEFYNGSTNKKELYKDIYEALNLIRIEGKTIKELYEANLIVFDIM